MPRPFAMITGASRGIGAHYARALAARDYDLLLVSRDKARMEQLQSELQSRHAVSLDCQVIDLAQPDAAHRLYAAARQRRPALDLLVNNAGFGLPGDFVDLPMARIQDMLRLHVNTVVESARLFLPGMIEHRRGGIITVSSIAGLFSVPYLAEYAATKAFLIAFSEALAQEVRPFGIRIQVCCPGFTATDFHATAGLQPKSLFRGQDPAEVVTVSLKRLERGPCLVLTHWSGRWTVFASRLIPRSLLARAAARWMKPSSES